MKRTKLPPVPPLSFMEPDTPVAICSPVLLWERYVQALPEDEKREVIRAPSVYPPLGYSPSLYSPVVSSSYLHPRVAPCPRSPRSHSTTSSSSSTARNSYGVASSIADSTSTSTSTSTSAPSPIASSPTIVLSMVSNPLHSRIARIKKAKSRTPRDNLPQRIETRTSRLVAKENSLEPHQVGWSNAESPVVLYFKKVSQERSEAIRERRVKPRELLDGRR